MYDYIRIPPDRRCEMGVEWDIESIMLITLYFKASSTEILCKLCEETDTYDSTNKKARLFGSMIMKNLTISPP